MPDRLMRSACLAALLPLLAAFVDACPDASTPCAPGPRRSALARHACAHGVAGLRGPARLLWGGRLDPSRLSAAELEVLPGIGPARARALRAAAPFAQADDLLHARGIGPRTLARLRPWLQLDPPPPPPAAPADGSACRNDPRRRSSRPGGAVPGAAIRGEADCAGGPLPPR